MNKRLSIIWVVIIFVVIIVLWVLEFNGTIAKRLEQEKVAKELKAFNKANSRRNKTQFQMNYNKNNVENTMKMNYVLDSFQILTTTKHNNVDNNSNSKLSLRMKKPVVNPWNWNSTKYYLSRSRRVKRGLLQRRFPDDEHGPEFRAPGDPDEEGGEGSSTTDEELLPGGPDQPDRRRTDCNRVLRKGKRVDKDFNPNLPPCRPRPPEQPEPIPAALYIGRLNFEEVCWNLSRVAQEQAKGREEERYRPEPPTLAPPKIKKYTNVHKGLDAKIEEVERHTCNRKKGLECVDPDILGNPPICKCMTAFGGKVDDRLVIDGTCYIPAGMDNHLSVCPKDDLPLPSGDTYNFKEWNPVALQCTPGSVCREHYQWPGKRCACKKGYVLDPRKGTCSGGISIRTTTMSLNFALIIIIMLSF